MNLLIKAAQDRMSGEDGLVTWLAFDLAVAGSLPEFLPFVTVKEL